jgi:hypothetical protein
MLVFGWPLFWTVARTGSGAYPLLYSQVLLGTILVLLATVLWQEIRLQVRARAGGEARERPFHPIEIAGFLVTCAYVWSWNLIGHVAATAVFLCAILLVAGERRPLAVIGVAVVLPVVIQLFFVGFLRIPLPGARWNFISF